MNPDWPEYIRLPFKSADFHFAPTELPRAETDLDTFLTECNRRINWLICEAWKTGALPARTALVGCLTVSPVKKIDFAHPWILRRDKPVGDQRVRLLGSFAHTTYHLKARQASSHKRVREKGDTSRGTMIVFTKEAPSAGSPRQLFVTNLLRFGFVKANWGEPLAFSDCSEDIISPAFYCSQILGPYEGAYEAFDADKFVSHASARKFGSITKRKSAPADWTGFPTSALCAERSSKTEGDLYKDILGDDQYRDRVAALLDCGAIVLCIPQSFAYPDIPNGDGLQEQNGTLDSGLTVILDGDDPPSEDALRQIYAVAHKISLFIASTEGIAVRLARQNPHLVARNAVGMLGHSMGNDLDDALATPGMLVPFVQIARINLKAAEELFYTSDNASSQDLSDELRVLLQTFYTRNNRPISIEFGTMTGVGVDIRFLALVLELCRNLGRHSREGSVELLKGLGADLEISIRVRGPTTRSEFVGIRNRLQNHDPYRTSGRLRGLDYIVWLAHVLGSDRTSTDVTFVDSEKNVRAHLTGRWQESHFRFEHEGSTADLPSLLNMVFEIRNLKAIRPKLAAS